MVSARSVANLTFGANSIGEPRVRIQAARSYCARERGGGTWMRWSFPSPASGCICRVPSITKARSSTYRHYDSLIAVPATISKVPTKAHLPAV